jgi:hypothetical protein
MEGGRERSQLSLTFDHRRRVDGEWLRRGGLMMLMGVAYGWCAAYLHIPHRTGSCRWLCVLSQRWCVPIYTHSLLMAILTHTLSLLPFCCCCNVLCHLRSHQTVLPTFFGPAQIFHITPIIYSRCFFTPATITILYKHSARIPLVSNALRPSKPKSITGVTSSGALRSHPLKHN